MNFDMTQILNPMLIINKFPDILELTIFTYIFQITLFTIPLQKEHKRAMRNFQEKKFSDDLVKYCIDAMEWFKHN